MKELFYLFIYFLLKQSNDEYISNWIILNEQTKLADRSEYSVYRGGNSLMSQHIVWAESTEVMVKDFFFF